MTGPTARVVRVKIEKFRAIREAEIMLEGTTAIVGANGSGKTSILRALNCFFNFEKEESYFRDGSHHHTLKTQILIEVEIEGLPSTTKLPTAIAGNGHLIARLKFRRQPVWECMLETGKWIKAPENLHDLLREILIYRLVPTRRDHLVAHGSSDSLLNLVADEWVSANKLRDRTSPQIRALAKTFHRNALAKLEYNLSVAAGLSGPFQFTLNYSETPDYRLLLKNLELAVIEGSSSVRLRDSGSGTQSMAVFALYSALAEMQNATYMLGFEEPEQNLHPQAQRLLTKRLAELGLQVLFTTHSPTVVDTLTHEQVIRCTRRVNSSGRLEIQTTQLPPDFFTQMGLNHDDYYKYHKRSNSEFMFADFVVVVEGVVDAAVVNQVLEDSGFDIAENGLSILPLHGVQNLRYVHPLLRQLGIPSVFVVDKDYFLSKTGTTGNGIPTYSNVATRGLVSLFPNASFRGKMVTNLREAHQKAAQELAKQDFFCFRHNLEVDIVSCKSGRERICEHLGIPTGSSARTLLVNNSKVIKQQEVLLQAVAELDGRQLPTTLQALRREIPKRAAAARL